MATEPTPAAAAILALLRELTMHVRNADALAAWERQLIADELETLADRVRSALSRPSPPSDPSP